MVASLDHTYIRSKQKLESATFLATILDVDPPINFGSIVRIELANGTCLDYHDAEEVGFQHFALLVNDLEFDTIVERMTRLGHEYYARGRYIRPHEIRERSGGARAIFLYDPDETSIEFVTRHYIPEAESTE